MARSFVIDFNSSIPIFQQIVNEVERRILTGELVEGEFLTSVREFAVAHTVNPNTVAKAYQTLQTMGLVTAIRGKGLAVNRLKQKAAHDRREDIIAEKIQELIAVGESLHLSVDDLVKLIEKAGRRK